MAFDGIVTKSIIAELKNTIIDGKINKVFEPNKNEIILQVKNKGNRIPEEEKEKIFKRFYRIDKSRNRNEKRYGLGLAIAKATIDKYNGKIDVLYDNGFTIFKVIFTI